MINLALRGRYVILCCVMKGVTDSGYRPEPRVRAMVRALVLVCMGLVLAAVGYGTYLMNTAPAVQDDAMQLEICGLKVAAVRDYLNHTRYLV